MKTKIINIDGKSGKEIELPKSFSAKIREDIVLKVLELKKTKQPYAPSPVAGKEYSARGKIQHRRHVWKSGYGRGASRVPRKTMSRRGSQFNWEAAGVPNVKGGFRAHPPKVVSMINTKKINKKELRIALMSAISATAEIEKVKKKYESLKDIKVEIKLPLIISSDISKLKTKQLLESLKKILGKELYKLGLKKKTIRSGKGKLRGRKYKSNAGLLLVLGNKEKIKTNAFEVKNVKNLGVVDLAKGGIGRLTLYTEDSIKDLEEKIK